MTKAERCEANIRAWARETGCPLPKIREACEDRCYVAMTPEFHTWCKTHMHQRTTGIRSHKPWGVTSAVIGWQERRPTWAAEVIEHAHPAHGEQGEIDFDRHNFRWGGVCEILHGLETLWHKLTLTKTNPFDVARARGWDKEPSCET